MWSFSERNITLGIIINKHAMHWDTYMYTVKISKSSKNSFWFYWGLYFINLIILISVHDLSKNDRRHAEKPTGVH